MGIWTARQQERGGKNQGMRDCHCLRSIIRVNRDLS
ncbi:hypothetical protein SETIT_2G052400v2 [Setaria italica]|uniref:Uncharacterized protein n=1 Tax=Setaria italica TaxID=4555 RepID=A0A368PVC2_SETIT|nr:hypothetical protein SETIT_2G052400v2 [Setaria italica]